jgi:alkanesulfonate monooxygenase SsuD/methylene tetrahydromethanopterin reductase-like flavin-dependent oxidoreductase (luciferase family)
LEMAAHIVGRTRRVRVGSAVVNLVFTHPLRFAERVAVLDHLSGGRVDVGVGRGYQWPQYPVFGMDIEESRPVFNEALDIILKAWEPEEFTYHGEHFQIPEVRIWPVPVRRPGELLLHTAVSPPSLHSSIGRGLPALLSKTFDPLETEAAWFSDYTKMIGDYNLDPEPFLDRATVMKYVFVAPTKEEAREASREAWEWDYSILSRLTTPQEGVALKGHELYEKRPEYWPEYTSFDNWAENVFLFDDPDGCAEKVAVLRDAGVRNLILWMGVGGVSHDLVARSMRLFAEEVMPRFR